MEQVNEEFATLARLYALVLDFVVNYSFQVLGAVIILLVGVVVSKWVARLVTDQCEKRDIDVTLRGFLASIARITVLSLFLIISLGKFGITVAPFIAAIGAVAFGATFALQGLFSNYAAGLTLIITRPFKVGNTITICGVSGVVDEIRLGLTLLSTEDGEAISIPNKLIIGEILQNSFESKVVEMIVGIDYDDDPVAATKTVEAALAAHPQVTNDPPPQVGVHGFGESSIDIGFRYWVPTRNYYQARYGANLKVYEALGKAGITIPYPRRDLEMRPGQPRTNEPRKN